MSAVAVSSSSRPRTIGPARSAAILYGDWGTSKAYVLGIAFAVAGYSSFPLLVAMAGLTALVALNYYWVCVLYPDGGGVYSAVRSRSRVIATVGALLLFADYMVTASLSTLEGFNYLAHLFEEALGLSFLPVVPCAIVMLLGLGVVNWFGSRHSGTLALWLAVPALLATLLLGASALPFLDEVKVVESPRSLGEQWFAFVGIVLALSGVEAISNMTGVMTPDRSSAPDGAVTVRRTAGLAILTVALEVVGMTLLLGAAMHAVPHLDGARSEAMLSQLAGYFGGSLMGSTAGKVFSGFVGIVISLLLFSAANTAINGMISVLFLMGRDGEVPQACTRLNQHGVPMLPLLLASGLSAGILLLFSDTHALAGLYAIGVVGAIAINLSACSTNRHLKMNWLIRTVMGMTALVMIAIWISLGMEKHEALVFAVTLVMIGLGTRAFIQERREARAALAPVAKTVAAVVSESAPSAREGPRILVALRGFTPTWDFAVELARARKARLGVLFVRQLMTMIPTGMRLEEDKDAVVLFGAMSATMPPDSTEFFYVASEHPVAAILAHAEAFGAETIILGAKAGRGVQNLFRGSIVNEVARRLPPGSNLIVYTWSGSLPSVPETITSEDGIAEAEAD